MKLKRIGHNWQHNTLYQRIVDDELVEDYYVDLNDLDDEPTELYRLSPYNDPDGEPNNIVTDFEIVNPMTDREKREKALAGKYMLLGRLRSDCDYFLGNGGRNEKVLWAGNVHDQIEKMKELWNSFPEDLKPEWLTMEQIIEYQMRM